MKLITQKQIFESKGPLRTIDFKIFKTKVSAYKCMWKTQGVEFWIPFVLIIRKSFLNTDIDKGYNDKCEKEWIDFLKVLTGKNFNDIYDYVELAHVGIREMTVILDSLNTGENVKKETENSITTRNHLNMLMTRTQCAGSFISLLPVWEKTEDIVDTMDFKPPENWFIPSTYCEPLESFIRSKWGNHRNIEQILGAKLDEIVWWKLPARKVDQNQLKDPEKVNCFDVFKKQVENESKKCDRTLQKNRILKVTNKWLPKKIFQNPMNLTQIGTIHDITLENIKYLLEFPCMPYLKRKYHIMNSRELLKNETNVYYLSKASWYALACDTFGSRYLAFVSDGCKDLLWRMTQVEVNEYHGIALLGDWNYNVEVDDLLVMNEMKDLDNYSPVESDCVTNTSEFLLEPCILIQLPWQTVVFYQWLAMASIEIIKFAVEVIELRHWPLSKEIEPMVKDLLSLVRDAKQRIYTGWNIISFNTTMPEGTPKRAKLIMSEIVLPTLSVLKFITTGSGYQIVAELKQKLWYNNQNIKEKYVPWENEYQNFMTIDITFMKFLPHYSNYDIRARVSHPFPSYYESTDSVHSILERAKEFTSKVNPTPMKPFSIHEYGSEERIIFNLIQLKMRDNSDGYSVAARMERIEQVLKEVIFKYHFTKETQEKVSKWIDSLEVRRQCYRAFKPDNPQLEPMESLIVSCILYCEVTPLVELFKKDPTVLGTISFLTALHTQKEQVVRIMTAISLLTGESPKLCNNVQCTLACKQHDVTFEISKMQQKIAQVYNEKYTFDSLYSNFPDEWKKPVELKRLNLEEDISVMVTELDTQVGRIIWNSSQENYKYPANPYPDSQIVQYVLPCYISYLLDAPKCSSPREIEKLHNLKIFVWSIVEHYVNTYKSWKKSPTVKRKVVKVADYLDDDELEVIRLPRHFLQNYLNDITSVILHCYAGLEEAKMPHFSIMYQHFKLFPDLTRSKSTQENTRLSPVESVKLQASVNIVTPHLQAIFDICTQKLPVPTPDSLLYCHELQDIYTAYAVIMQLDLYYKLSDWYAKEIEESKGMGSFFFVIHSSQIQALKYEMFTIIFETENHFEYPKSMITAFANDELKNMLKDLFGTFIKSRKLATKFKVDLSWLPKWGTKTLKSYVEQFVNNKLQNLPLFEKKVIVESKKVRQGTLAECNNCHRKETVPMSFIRCKACIQHKFPYPNFYCSDRCERMWWTCEHMAEHLEFELGLN